MICLIGAVELSATVSETSNCSEKTGLIDVTLVGTFVDDILVCATGPVEFIAIVSRIVISPFKVGLFEELVGIFNILELIWGITFSVFEDEFVEAELVCVLLLSWAYAVPQ